MVPAARSYANACSKPAAVREVPTTAPSETAIALLVAPPRVPRSRIVPVATS